MGLTWRPKQYKWLALKTHFFGVVRTCNPILPAHSICTVQVSGPEALAAALLQLCLSNWHLCSLVNMQLRAAQRNNHVHKYDQLSSKAMKRQKLLVATEAAPFLYTTVGHCGHCYKHGECMVACCSLNKSLLKDRMLHTFQVTSLCSGPGALLAGRDTWSYMQVYPFIFCRRVPPRGIDAVTESADLFIEIYAHHMCY